MRWLIYGDINSRHAVDSLIAALRDAGHGVIDVPSVDRGHFFAPDPAIEAESQRRIDAAMPADVLFNFRPEELTPGQIELLRERGVMTLAWFTDDPLLYRVCYQHVVEAYDLVLHAGREDVLAFYEERHGTHGYSFPFWTDDEHFPYAYDPDAADIEVGFLGNAHLHRRNERYELLANLPWRTRFFGRLPRGSRATPADDYAGIHGGLLERDEISTAVRRFRVAINMSQQFLDVEDRYDFPELARFGEYFFPSRLVIYAAVGIPTVSLTLPGSEPPFPSVITASTRDELIERIGALLDDRESLLATSERTRRDFEACLTAQSRAAMLDSLLREQRDRAAAERADFWRSFAPAAAQPAQALAAPFSGDGPAKVEPSRLAPSTLHLTTQRRIHWMCSHVTGGDILDLGCGLGVTVLLLARERKRVIGVDIDSTSRPLAGWRFSTNSQARGRLEREEPDVQARAELLEADARELPFDDESFDTVLLDEVLQRSADPAGVLREAARVLRPGGHAVVAELYGVPVRYSDRTERLYLDQLFDLLGDDLQPRNLELIDRHVGLVAVSGGDGVGSAIWRQRLKMPEDLLRERDRRLDELELSLQRRRQVIEDEEARARAQLEVAVRERGAFSAAAYRQRKQLKRQKRQLDDLKLELEWETKRVEELRSGRAARLARRLSRIGTRLRHPIRGRSRHGAAKPSRDLGMSAYGRQDWTVAVKALREATQIDPENLVTWLYLARAERNAGKLEDSLATISNALEHESGWAPGVWHAADVQAQLGRLDEARRTLRAFDRIDATKPPDLVRLGRLAVRLGALDVAVSAAEQLLEQDAESDEARQLLGSFPRTDESRDRVLAVAERLAAGGQDGSLAASIGLFLRFGDIERALGLLPTLKTSDAALISPIARRLVEYGFLRQALELLDRAPSNSMLDPLRNRIAASLRIFREDWRPPAPPAMDLRPVEGRVLHMTGASLPHQISGYTVRTHELAKAQGATGLDPQVLTRAGFGVRGHQANGGGRPFISESLDGVIYHRVPRRGPPGDRPTDERLGENVDLAVPILEEVQPAVLHPASDYHNALVALSLREATGLPVVYEVRGFWEESWLSRQPEAVVDGDAYVGRRKTETRCMLEADHVVTLGEVMKRYIVSRGVPPEKVTVVPNAVDAEAFGSIAHSGRLAQDLGIPPDDVVIGYAGSLVGYEGLDDLVRAVASLSERRSDIHCVLVGNGPARTDLEGLAADVGVSDRVRFVGAVPPETTRDYYALIDVFVLPRRQKRVCELVTPLKPYEAMAAECAVVVSDLDALREIVTDGQTGLVTPAEDAKALAGTLELLIDDATYRCSLAKTASEWVRSERTWARNAEAYRAIYEAVCS